MQTSQVDPTCCVIPVCSAVEMSRRELSVGIGKPTCHIERYGVQPCGGVAEFGSCAGLGEVADDVEVNVAAARGGIQSAIQGQSIFSTRATWICYALRETPSIRPAAGKARCDNPRRYLG